MNESLAERVQQWIWYSQGRTPLERVGMVCLRYSAACVRELARGDLSMRAMSLVYTTLLTLVPFLALGFSLLKAFGVHNSIEPVLLNLFSPLGENAAEITSTIIGFVENIQVGVLGSVGLGLLLYAAVSLIQKVERSFNAVWHISRPRPFAQRFGEYLSVLVVGPLVIFSVLGLTATITRYLAVDQMVDEDLVSIPAHFMGRVGPYLVIAGFFTFLYAFVPNTRVRWRAAAIGGVAAGILWQTGSWMFAAFVASAGNYNAIYSGFAILIFLLIWLYVAWLILLIGCQLAFFVQQPEFVRPQEPEKDLLGFDREWLSLEVLIQVGVAFAQGKAQLNAEKLIHNLPDTEPSQVTQVLEWLIEAGLVVESNDVDPALLPGQDLAQLKVVDVLQQARGVPDEEEASSVAWRLMRQVEVSLSDAVGEQRVSELVAQQLVNHPEIPANSPV